MVQTSGNNKMWDPPLIINNIRKEYSEDAENLRD